MATETLNRGSTAAGRADAGGSRGKSRSGELMAWLFLAPYLVLFTVFVLAPIVLGIWISLHDWDFTLPGKPFVGLSNYKDLFDSGSVTFAPFWNGMGGPTTSLSSFVSETSAPDTASST